MKENPVIIDPNTKTATYAYTSPVENETDDIDLERGRKNGVTKVVFYWNFTRVWLSRSSLRHGSFPVVLAGKLSPNKIVGRALGFVGTAAKVSPGGIQFDYNRFVGAVWNVR